MDTPTTATAVYALQNQAIPAVSDFAVAILDVTAPRRNSIPRCSQNDGPTTLGTPFSAMLRFLQGLL
jgi:hypothetical protein